MAEALKVGSTGCGKIAHEDHVPGWLGVKGAKITALCDVNPAKMGTLSAKFGLGDAARFSDAASMFRSGVDAVVVCTPNKLHRPMTLDALKAGLHVLCEKPMAATTPETTRMIAAARRAGRMLHINHSLHYEPPYVALGKLARPGAIGKPIHLRCLRACGTTPDIGWSPGATWFVQKAWEGSLVLDIGVHMAEMMRWCAGPVTELAAFTGTRKPGIDVVDHAAVIMRFENGATGVLELSWVTPCGGGFFEIYGEKGTLRMGFTDAAPIELIKPGRNGAPDAVTHPNVPAKHITSQQAFFDAIRGKAPSPTPGELGREAIALCEAIAKSGETGKFVKVKKF